VLKTSTSGNEVTAVLNTASSHRNMMFFLRDFRNQLNLKLNDNFPIDLDVATGASDLNFDLSGIKLSNFILRAGASNIDIRIGTTVQNGAKADIQAGASDINIEVPQEAGVKIIAESGLTSERFEGFNKKADDTWESEGYEAAAKKITVELRAGASSVEVIRY
jgi:hypothetical protein